MEFPITITLKNPIPYGDDTIKEIKIPRGLKAKDLKNIPIGTPETDKTMIIIGRLTCQPPSVIDELSLEDLNTISEEVDRFLVPSPMPGKIA
jgi:hypothetical protein